MSTRPAEEIAPQLRAFSGLAPELAATFVTVASDIALVVDRDGVIRNVAVAREGGPIPAGADWVGRRWADTVTDDTRRKIELLLSETATMGVSQRREVTLRAADGADIPVAWAAVRLGDDGPLLAVGRDLRAIAAIQQRFVESQHEMERDYWRRRQAEGRYRLLFQVATDAVLVVDASTRKIVEVNRAAAALFGLPASQLAGREASAGFNATGRQAVDELLTTAHLRGQPAEIRIVADGEMLALSAAPFRAEGTPLLMLRVQRADVGADAPGGSGALAELVERTPDAIVVTDSGGHVRHANPAFLTLCGLPPQADIAGRPLAEWLGGSAREAGELLDHVRRHGIAAQLGCRLRRADGAAGANVELSAALLPDGDGGQDAIGVTLRRLQPRGGAEDATLDELSHAVQRLAARVGSQILPSLMREGADLIERHLLRAALLRSAEPAEAARLLGISEESLVLRLRRHGLLDDGIAGGPAVAP